MFKRILCLHFLFLFVNLTPTLTQDTLIANLHWSDPAYIAGDFDPQYHPDFIKIDSVYTDSEKYMQMEAYASFVNMAQEAKKAGIELKIVSAFRSFNTQKKIWEDKWEGRTLFSKKSLDIFHAHPVKKAKKIMEYTAPPGISRHHWGTDIDLNSVEPEYFQTKKGMKTFAWLKKHAHTFGFYQTYTKKGSARTYGFKEEKWHWSYTALSAKIWSEQIKQYKPFSYQSFLGDKAVFELPILEHYIKMVNQ